MSRNNSHDGPGDTPGRVDLNSEGLDPMDDSKMNCERVLALVPGFVDGEVSDGVASSVRQHLIDCSPCRVAVQDETALRQWFEPVAEDDEAGIEVPAGFAARVADLAFASAGAGSDQGRTESADSTESTGSTERTHTLRPVPAALGPQLGPQLVTGGGAVAAGTIEPKRDLTFAMMLTAVAAAILMGFTLLLASQNRVESKADLSADQSVFEQIEEMNRAEASDASLDASETDAR